jgi:hypothetical protein
MSGMHRPLRAAALGLAGAMSAAVLAACGGSSVQTLPGLIPNTTRPLSASTTPETNPALAVPGIALKRVTYDAYDGSTVPALFAVPTGVRTRGCLIYQGGITQTKEQSKPLWAGAGAFGLATFTIDPRATGERGSVEELQTLVNSTPKAVRTTILESASDLRRGLEYLYARPECHRNVGFLGTSYGAVIGSILSGSDTRVKATALTSIGATWQEALTRPGSPILPEVDQGKKALDAAVGTLAPLNPSAWVRRIAPRPVLLMNGTHDPNVSVADAAQLADSAGEPKVVVNFDGGHDPFAPPGVSPSAIQSNLTAVGTFLKKYLLGESST